ncbi:MAG: DNA polymerase III subunit delta' [Chromatiales bacterium]|nr:DNA polymerase III subunit delta' [Chromatiales bacterium]
MIEKNLYPWQREAWQNWQHYLRLKTVPHAILLHGRIGCGVNDFALRLCCSLLCAQDNIDKPCLNCDSCRIFLSGNHPDCLVIEAEQQQIKVQQVRSAIDFLHIGRQYPYYKIVLLKEADSLNYAAANSLLKTLEEPPPETVVLMTCRQPSNLTPTIRSRCHHIYLKEPGSEAVTWLAEQMSITEEAAQHKLTISNNSPLGVLNNIIDNENKSLFYQELERWLAKRLPTHEFVEHWHEKSSMEIQQWLLEYLQRTIMQQAKGVLANDNEVSVSRSNLSNLLYWLHPRQIERCRLAEQNINPRLLLEGSLLEWRKAYYNN